MKKILVIIFLMGIIGGGIGYMMYQKPAATVAKGKAEASITAVELMQSYEQDEAEANSAYLGKTIEVTGTIQEISKEGEAVKILLETNSLLGTINCKLGNASDAASLSAQDQITIKGECTGYLMDVVLNKCTVTSKN